MTAAVERRTPFIIFTASGGARMQEGIFSLMQMPRTTVAVQRLRDARLPYIVVLDQSDDRRRHGLLCHARRYPHRRTRRGHRFRRRAGDRADDPRTPAGRLSARRISRSAWHDRHGGTAADMRATLARLCALSDADPARSSTPPPEGRDARRIMDSLDALLSRLLHAASQADRTVARPDRAAACRARVAAEASAADHSCRRNQW